MTDATCLWQARTVRITVLSYAVTARRRRLTEAELERLERAESNLAYFEGELQEATLQQCTTYLKGASECNPR